MLYIQHARVKQQYEDAVKVYQSIADRQADKNQATQPDASRSQLSELPAVADLQNQAASQAAEEREAADPWLKEAAYIVKQWGELLQRIERDLSQDRDIKNRIYRYVILEKRSMKETAAMVERSRQQVYRILKEIKAQISQAVGATTSPPST